LTLIEKRIKEMGIKKTWLAEQCNITPRQLTRWIKYENMTQINNFMRLINILNISIDELKEDIKRIGK
jgi:hypothetical protein